MPPGIIAPECSMPRDQGHTPCPFRFIDRGRTYCRLAITERKYTTCEVTPSVCMTCHIPHILREYGCAHLSLGVEVDEFGGRLSADMHYCACQITVERLRNPAETCGPDLCEDWAPWRPESVEGIAEQRPPAPARGERAGE